MQNDSSDTETNLTKRSKKWMAPVSLLAIGFLYFASQIVGGAVVYLYPAIRGWSADQTSQWVTTSIFAQFLYILLSEAVLVIAIYGLLKMFAWSWQTIGLIKPKLSHIGLGILAVVPYFILYVIIVMLVQLFYPALNTGQEQQLGFGATKNTLELLLVFLSLVVLPPLVEEVSVRGFLYSGLRTKFSKIVSALLVSGVFGLAHLSQGGAAGPLWIGFIDTFTLSLVLVFLREKTGNLWAGITLHAIKNGVAFVSLFVLHVR